LLSSLLIIAISVLLFHYWFRYTCLLILATKTPKDYTPQVAADNQLEFLETQKQLGRLELDPLSALERSLARDYQRLSDLLGDAANVSGGNHDTLEGAILKTDFHLMRAWYRVSRPASEAQARRALREMSSIIAHMANNLGERLASSAGA